MYRGKLSHYIERMPWQHCNVAYLMCNNKPNSRTAKHLQWIDYVTLSWNGSHKCSDIAHQQTYTLLDFRLGAPFDAK